MPDGYDLVIIGTGAAGTSAATRAHHLGAGRMVMVEQGPLWGTCVNNGCIPSKFLLAVGEIHRYRNYGHAGLRVGSSLDMHEVIREKRDLILRLRERKARRIFGEFGIELMEGAARFLTPHTLDVGGRTLSARRFIIATGSSPLVPAVDGLSGVPFLTSLGALELEEVPESVIVLGGRSLGLEFAQILAHLGSQVTLLQRSPRIIPGEEPEISAAMEDALAGEGIAVHTGAELVRVRNEEAGAVSVTARVKGKGEKFAAARLLLATGRAPNTGELDLAACGVAVDRKGAIIVDDTMQTSAPHIWAAGDRRADARAPGRGRGCDRGRERDNREGEADRHEGPPPRDLHLPAGGLGGDDREQGKNLRNRGDVPVGIPRRDIPGAHDRRFPRPRENRRRGRDRDGARGPRLRPARRRDHRRGGACREARPHRA